MREDEPGFARAIGMAAWRHSSCASPILVFNKIRRASSPRLGGFFAVVGVAMLLFHAAREGVEIRRPTAWWVSC